MVHTLSFILSMVYTDIFSLCSVALYILFLFYIIVPLQHFYSDEVTQHLGFVYSLLLVGVFTMFSLLIFIGVLGKAC